MVMDGVRARARARQPATCFRKILPFSVFIRRSPSCNYDRRENLIFPSDSLWRFAEAKQRTRNRQQHLHLARLVRRIYIYSSDFPGTNFTFVSLPLFSQRRQTAVPSTATTTTTTNTKNDDKSDYVYNLFLSEIESTPNRHMNEANAHTHTHTQCDTLKMWMAQGDDARLVPRNTQK